MSEGVVGANKRAIQVFGEVVRVLEGVKESEFNIDIWRCGAVGCVLGHCSMDSWFNKQGLIWDDKELRPCLEKDRSVAGKYAFKELITMVTWKHTAMCSWIFFKSNYPIKFDGLNIVTKEEVLARVKAIVLFLETGEVAEALSGYLVGELSLLKDEVLDASV